MLLAKGTIIAVADGERLSLFENTGDESGLKLMEMPKQDIASDNVTSGGHQASSGNPDHGQVGEDGFSAASCSISTSRCWQGRSTT